MTLSGARILVDGATGYLGGHFIAQFRKSGAKVRALVRPEASHEKLAFLSAQPVEIISAALGSKECERAFLDVDIAVHLIGSIAPGKGESFENLHIENSLKFASLARSCHRVLMVTALGASAKSESGYLRTKAQSEAVMKGELGSVPLAILRPSLIVGRTVGFRHSKLVKRYIDLLRADKPFVPLVGGGKNLIQPVFVEDLAKAAVKVLEDRSQGVFEIGGLEALSMRDFVLRLQRALKIEKPLVDVPLPVAYLAAQMLTLFSQVPALSCDQVKMASFDNVCSDNALPELLDRVTLLDQALATYVEDSCPGS